MNTFTKTNPTKEIVLNEQAVKIAVKIIKQFEGCNLIAYPDPASDLYKALSTHNMLGKYMSGKIKFNDLEPHFQALNGKPWTAMYGETDGIKPGDTFTQQEADERLIVRVKYFMTEVLKASPKLINESAEKIAAVTSLCYNIGMSNYKNSTVCKEIAAGKYKEASDAILLWNRAQGQILDGLVKRRKTESDLFRSV